MTEVEEDAEWCDRNHGPTDQVSGPKISHQVRMANEMAEQDQNRKLVSQFTPISMDGR